MVANSSFSACLSPQEATVSSEKRAVRPPRPHTTTAASSSSFFTPRSKPNQNLWDDIRELTDDVKDGVRGLKEVWSQNSKCSFIDDLSEFVDPHLESLGVVDGPHTTGNAKLKKNEGDAKFFTFDKMERLLNYCVPLAVDPRSPKSRARDTTGEVEVNVSEDIVDKASSGESERTILEEEDGSLQDVADVVNPEQMRSSSGELPGFSEGLLEHTNRLREKMMGRSRHRSGALTTPARVLEERMNLQGRRSASSSSEEHDVANSPVVVPGGLWSLPSEERYGNSLSQSFADSRSMHSSYSEERYHTGMKNAYYSGPSKMDDVLMMRSMSVDDAGESQDSFPSNGSDLTDLRINAGDRRSQSPSRSFEQNVSEKLNVDLVLDTDLGLECRDDMDDVINAAAVNAMNGLVSPSSLASEDKYMLGDEEEKEERLEEQDPYAYTHKFSHYRNARELVSEYQGDTAESRDDKNEAANRHFDSLISDFELNLNNHDENKIKSTNDRLQRYHEQKRVVKRSREKKPTSKSSQVDDDALSKASHSSNYSTASFLHQTTMGRKLNRSPTRLMGGSASGSVAASKDSVLNRARQAVTQVHQVIESIGDKDDKNPTDDVGVDAAGIKHAESSKSISKHRPTIQESAMATYKKRLMEQRSRRIQRDNASKEREEDARIQTSETNKTSNEIKHVPAPIAKEQPVTNSIIDTILREPSQEEADLGINDSGAASFDSSVNWDALAYSMSESVSELPVAHVGDVATETMRPGPIDSKPALHQGSQYHELQSTNAVDISELIVADPSPQQQYPAMARIEKIKQQHDKKMKQLRTPSPGSLDTYHSEINDEAPDDECGPNKLALASPSEEENRPISPNSCAGSDCLSPKSKANLSDAVRKHIEAMRHQIQSEMANNEKRSMTTPTSARGKTTPTSARQQSSRFSFESPSRPSPKESLKPSTADLMLSTLQLEEEMEQIKALSPRSPDSWTSPRSPLSRKFFGDSQIVSSPRSQSVVSPRSPGNYTPPHLRNYDSKFALKVEIPTSPISIPRRRLGSPISESSKTSKSVLSPRSPREDRARTRVSDLMAEVKGFLAENDRARERIARDMDAMQALHNY